ncbi:HAMP domain-containing histidine kinase [Labedella populi]|uniref:histidine kinase n=1 Tax=Labedella populi TaxID=2498850 RepID=A0A3S4A273_9MICO|nr:HAMP domain-containing histidine kinase [Labedella populi]
MTGYLELLEDSLDPSDTDSLRYLEVISRNVAGLRYGIADLLVATDTDRPLHVASLDARTIVDDAIALTAEAAERRRQLVEVRRDGAESVRIEGDVMRLRHTVAELLENAIKFSPEGSRITLTQSTGPEGVTITVEDRGAALTRGETGTDVRSLLPHEPRPLEGATHSRRPRHRDGAVDRPLPRVPRCCGSAVIYGPKESGCTTRAALRHRGR